MMAARIITAIQAHPFLWVIATSACRKFPQPTSARAAYQDDFIVYHFHTISQYVRTIETMSLMIFIGSVLFLLPSEGKAVDKRPL